MRCLAVLLILLLSSCVTYQPVPENYSGSLSIIKDTSKRASFSKQYFFQLREVDSRAVYTSSLKTSDASYGQGARINLRIEEREVPSGKVTLSLEAITYVSAPILALGGGMYRVSGDVDVDLKPNETYFVRGMLSKSYSAVWLEDSEGNVVSQKIEK